MEITEIVGLKEYTIRVNNLKLIEKSFLQAITFLTFFYVLVLYMASILLTLPLKEGQLDTKALVSGGVLYFLFFLLVNLVNYKFSKKDKNIGYLFFVVLHINNVFGFIPWIAIPSTLLNGSPGDVVVTVVIYSVLCMCAYCSITNFRKGWLS
ncbi:hypothetical protein PRVXT_002701 [Proteinivorax tanatarense]|uniref:Uncharacterized protein n=1 Tax=Proteinivorax tanatarense TaxID=1260629 RepID=A0AAU7VKR3_9FIRM